MNLEQFKHLLDKHGQSHVYQQIPDLTVDHPIFKQLTNLDIQQSLNAYNENQHSTSTLQHLREASPIESFNYSTADESTKIELENIGYEAISQGKVASIILSGGQGTRLGFSGPKGMYNLGMPSNKTIFQIHIEKILKISRLCLEKKGVLPSIPVYIMTSDLNDKIIREYFEHENYFGYPKEDVFFFEQALELCLSLDGKIIVESPSSVALAPDGNGGIYSALVKSGALADLSGRGVEHLHVYGIDNVLTRSLDPAFLGLCIRSGAQVGNKVVWRADKSEKVGVTARRGDRMCVLEYSEIPPHLAEAQDEGGKLLFGAANICNHYLSLPFLQNEVLSNLIASYHIAHKKIPYWDPSTGQTLSPSTNNGIKLEMFIFDVFPLATRWVVMEGLREEEFAPVKNAPGSSQDSPDTARALLSAQSQRWLERAGATLLCPSPSSSPSPSPSPVYCEVSPLLSYGGEGLEGFRGREVTLPCYLSHVIDADADGDISEENESQCLSPRKRDRGEGEEKKEREENEEGEGAKEKEGRRESSQI